MTSTATPLVLLLVVAKTEYGTVPVAPFIPGERNMHHRCGRSPPHPSAADSSSSPGGTTTSHLSCPVSGSFLALSKTSSFSLRALNLAHSPLVEIEIPVTSPQWGHCRTGSRLVSCSCCALHSTASTIRSTLQDSCVASPVAVRS